MPRSRTRKRLPPRRRGPRGSVETPKLVSLNRRSPGNPIALAVQRVLSGVILWKGRAGRLRGGTVLLALALALALSSTASADGGTGTLPGDTGPLIDALRTLAKVIVNTLIAVAAILMVVGVATGFVAGQLLTTLGAPYGASTAMLRVVSVILLAVGAFLTTVIANAVIDAVAGMVPPTDIRVPTPGGGSGYLEQLLPAARAWAQSWLAQGIVPFDS